MELRRTLLKRQLFVFFALIIASQTNAAHIIGSHMTYQCLYIDNDNLSSTYRINVTMYRDADGGGAQFDDPAFFGIYLGSSQNWELFKSPIRVKPDSIQDLQIEEDLCIMVPPKIGILEECEIIKNNPDLIEVKSGPIADYSFESNEVAVVTPNVAFTNLSQNTSGYLWQFCQFGFSYEEHPSFEFPDTGIIKVDLIGFHPLGCSDRITKQIDIKPVHTYFMSNAFTPNNDGLNDVFVGRGRVDYISNFDL